MFEFNTNKLSMIVLSVSIAIALASQVSAAEKMTVELRAPSGSSVNAYLPVWVRVYDESGSDLLEERLVEDAASVVLDNERIAAGNAYWITIVSDLQEDGTQLGATRRINILNDIDDVIVVPLNLHKLRDLEIDVGVNEHDDMNLSVQSLREIGEDKMYFRISSWRWEDGCIQVQDVEGSALTYRRYRIAVHWERPLSRTYHSPIFEVVDGEGPQLERWRIPRPATVRFALPNLHGVDVDHVTLSGGADIVYEGVDRPRLKRVGDGGSEWAVRGDYLQPGSHVMTIYYDEKQGSRTSPVKLPVYISAQNIEEGGDIAVAEDGDQGREDMTSEKVPVEIQVNSGMEDGASDLYFLVVRPEKGDDQPAFIQRPWGTSANLNLKPGRYQLSAYGFLHAPLNSTFTVEDDPLTREVSLRPVELSRLPPGIDSEWMYEIFIEGADGNYFAHDRMVGIGSLSHGAYNEEIGGIPAYDDPRSMLLAVLTSDARVIVAASDFLQKGADIMDPARVVNLIIQNNDEVRESFMEVNSPNEVLAFEDHDPFDEEGIDANKRAVPLELTDIRWPEVPLLRVFMDEDGGVDVDSKILPGTYILSRGGWRSDPFTVTDEIDDAEQPIIMRFVIDD